MFSGQGPDWGWGELLATNRGRTIYEAVTLAPDFPHEPVREALLRNQAQGVRGALASSNLSRRSQR